MLTVDLLHVSLGIEPRSSCFLLPNHYTGTAVSHIVILVRFYYRLETYIKMLGG